MAKSSKPLVWAPFAAGGTLTAFLTPVSIVLTLLVSLGHPPAVFSYESMHALAAHWAGKLAFAVVIGLSLWSAAHRMRITAYDLGLRADGLVAAFLYTAALAGTGAAAYHLLRI